MLLDRQNTLGEEDNPNDAWVFKPTAADELITVQSQPDLEQEAFAQTNSRPRHAAELESPEAQVSERLTSQVLVAASLCATKAKYMLVHPQQKLAELHGHISLKPSPIANEALQDGREYEKALLSDEHRETLIRMINRGTGLSLPVSVGITSCVHEYRLQKLSYARNLSEQLVHTKRLLDGAKAGEPHIFTQAMLGGMIDGAWECGKPDILVWTGAQWVIGDIKRSDDVSCGHGIQVYYYYILFGRFGHIIGSPADFGFIIHCLPGKLFHAASTNYVRDQAVLCSMAKAFPLAVMQDAYTRNHELVRNPTDACTFKRACVECLYRDMCYKQFLQTSTVPLHLVPLSEVEYGQLGRAGIATAADLEAMGRDHPLLLELKGGDKRQVDMLIHRAAIAKQQWGFSKWRSKEGWENSSLLFANFAGESAWMEGDRILPQPPEVLPTVIVAYTDRELQMAKRELWRYYPGRQRELNSRDYVCLLDEINESVHIPMVSQSIRATAYHLSNLTDSTIDMRVIVGNWLVSDPTADTEDVINSTIRVGLLAKIWRGLLALERSCS